MTFLINWCIENIIFVHTSVELITLSFFFINILLVYILLYLFSCWENVTHCRLLYGFSVNTYIFNTSIRFFAILLFQYFFFLRNNVYLKYFLFLLIRLVAISSLNLKVRCCQRISQYLFNILRKHFVLH